jgi:hypothetical protein
MFMKSNNLPEDEELNEKGESEHCTDLSGETIVLQAAQTAA